MRQWIVVICALILSLYGEEGSSVVEDRCGLSIATPSLATRESLKLRLPNGLEAYLLSDPGAFQSGAALAVGVGSYDEPADQAGLAHFLEHMLFLGTEKYPEEHGFTRFLDEHGGTRNACTCEDRTLYVFSVDHSAFSEALDRFAQFFHAPLFNPSGVSRELTAIDQEFAKNVPQDLWRQIYVKKALSLEEHPSHRFNIGNKESLSAILPKHLKAWFETHYSANLMHLVLYSALPLEEMRELVESYFSPIPNLRCTAKSVGVPLIASQSCAKWISIVPVQSVQALELAWELPAPFQTELEVRPDLLLSYILGHEGPQSLLAQLKEEQLAEWLSSSSENAGGGQRVFHLAIGLTEKGVREREAVLQRCFEAFNALKKSGIPEYILAEYKKSAHLRYQYQSREEVFRTVMQYANLLVDEPLESFPRKSLAPETYSKELTRQLLHHFTPYNCQFVLIADPKISGIPPTHEERWMGVSYGVSSLPKELLDRLHRASSKNNYLPSPNRFLPEALALVEERTCERPKLLEESAWGKLYLCQDDCFLAPEISWHFTLRSPHLLDSESRSQLLADCYCKSVREHLNAMTYEAGLAHLSFSLTPTHNGLSLSLNGYSEKALPLLKEVLCELEHHRPDPVHFARYKEALQREYNLRIQSSPIAQGTELLLSLLMRDFTSTQEKLDLLEGLSFEEFFHFCQEVWSRTYVEGMAYGNVPLEEGHAIWKLFSQTLAREAYPIEEHEKLALASFPETKGPFLLTQKSALPDNALILVFEGGDFSFKKQAAQEILAKGLEEPFFSELRTRQQTAYLVGNCVQEIESHLYSLFLIQSHTHTTRDLLARFELFLESALQNLSLQVIPRERFEEIQRALILAKRHPAHNIQEQGALLSSLAFTYGGDFERLERQIEALQELSYDEFLLLAHGLLGKENRKRVALSIDGKLPDSGVLLYKKAQNREKLKNHFKYQPKE